jgi:molecular chaperone HtpG
MVLVIGLSQRSPGTSDRASRVIYEQLPLIFLGIEFNLYTMSNNLIIPDPLCKLLENSPINRLVEEIKASYVPWLEKNETIFFREYTNHGIDHVNGVLETADFLITDRSRRYLTANDAALLIISTILHDIALQITEDQFLNLVNGDAKDTRIKGIDFISWDQLWEKYITEVTRYSQADLILFFGIGDPVRAPDLKSHKEWGKQEYKIIGEFLRRHHTRLAHQYAVFGYPVINGKNVSYVKPANDFKDYLNLAGLIARSHGSSIREYLQYLKKTFGSQQTQFTAKTVYLMALLRIADFLQLQKLRADEPLRKIKNIQSPLSKIEWSLHNAIKDIIYIKDDPESFQILVDPEAVDINLYLRAENLIYSLQKELDHSWAVLGEVYGRFPELEGLGLKFRRVLSNIDDREKFGDEAGFVPQRATFTAANAELLKLLIQPLYGDRPEIAVRELIQNSIDAVHEKSFLENKVPDKDEAVITVSVIKHKKNKWTLRVEDNGVGMTLNTITNYFLNAGASYRLSNPWKEKFLNKRSKSQILRSGRFGIGVLAAFLLGDNPTDIDISVTTRHYLEPENKGYEFTTKLIDSPIEIKFKSKLKPGTIIEITTGKPPKFMTTVGNETLDKSWDWYCLDFPIVKRINHLGTVLAQSTAMPRVKEGSPSNYHWLDLRKEDYESVGWCYDESPKTVCNGLLITEDMAKFPLRTGKFFELHISIAMPSLSIFDKDAVLPITLDRLRVDYPKLQFYEELRLDVERNILAFLLISCPSSNIFMAEEYDQPKLIHPAFEGVLNSIPWLLSKEGAILYCQELVVFSSAVSVIELSDPALLTTILSSADKPPPIAITFSSFSLWDLYVEQNNFLGCKFSYENKIAEKEDIQAIFNLIESNYKESEFSPLAIQVVNDFFDTSTGSKELENFEIATIIKREIFNRKAHDDQNLQASMESISNYARDGKLSRDNLKQIFYWVKNSKKSIEGKWVLKLIEETLFNNEATDAADLIHKIKIEVDKLMAIKTSNPHIDPTNLGNKIQDRVNMDALKRIKLRVLDEILVGLKNTCTMKTYTDLDKKGTFTSSLDWTLIRAHNFLGLESSSPIKEISITNNFATKSSVNILANIWLNFIGKTEIPLDSEKRQRVIDDISKKHLLERHLVHWKKKLIEISP